MDDWLGPGRLWGTCGTTPPLRREARRTCKFFVPEREIKIVHLRGFLAVPPGSFR